jgi:hypothetical protein
VLIMGAHTMRTLGCSVTASVDLTYTAADLCDGDPSTPVRVDGGSLSAALAFTSGSIDGLVVVNHNLDAAESVAFSGLGTVTTPPVPYNDIMLNGLEILSAPVTVASTTVTVTAGGPVVIGDVIAGLFAEIRTLPPRADFPHRPFMVLPDGEFPTLSYTKGAIARAIGGSVYLDDTMHGVMQDAFDASWENSRPTIIVPFCAVGSPETFSDPWLVTWLTYNPHPIRPNLWHVDVVWTELPRYRWPA